METFTLLVTRGLLNNLSIWNWYEMEVIVIIVIMILSISSYSHIP